VISAPWASQRHPGSVAITVAVPVRDAQGSVVGQLHGAVRVDGGNIAGDLARISVGKGGYFVIITRERVRVSHPDAARVLKVVPPGGNPAVDRAIDAGFEGVTATTSTTGVEMLAVVKRLAAVDWFVFGNLPMDELVGPFRASLPLYAGAAAAGLVLLTIAVWLSLRRATRPLVEMTEAVERIADHPGAGQRIGGAGQGEVARLAGSFDRLLEALDARELEQRRAEEERRRLEERLQAQQRLDSLGVLAGGIAHDFNNVLAAILGNLSIARDDLGPGHPVQQPLAMVQQASIRARSLVQQILAFSRRLPQERVVQPLAPLVAEALALLRATLPASVQLEAHLPDLPLAAEVDAGQIQQVVLNLCNNAWQALPGQLGRIGVHLDAVTIAAGDEAAGSPPAGRYARLSVVDNGSGMDEATRARIFEPFFTTKPVGQGTGLGLAVVHGIVAASGGSIAVHSTQGLGTRIDVHLPLRDGDDCAPAAVPVAEGAQRGQGEHVLLADDDDVVGLTLQALLERAGYRVTRVGSGLAAIEAVRLAPRGHDLVVTDFNMPGLSGLVVAERIARLAPGLPVIITSGYVTEDLLEQARDLGVRAVLLKEHSLERLTRVVHELLAGATRDGDAAADVRSA
jgi:signal transduction histidine kinase/ActR/RegA family two-component response regulator